MITIHFYVNQYTIRKVGMKWGLLDRLLTVTIRNNKEVLNVYMDKRSMQILQEIINDPKTNLSALEKKLVLNRRQINYSLEKINNWVREMNHPKIERTKTGNFLVPSTLIHLLPINNDDLDFVVETYILSEKERISVILIMLLCREEDLSLHHLVSALGLGKNTILRTISAAQAELENYNLKINYSRQKGYRITGKEYDKRRLLVMVIQSILSFFNGEKILLSYSGLVESEVEDLREKLEHIEVYLSIKFTDERFLALPYIIAVWKKRVNMGKIIEPNFHIDFLDLKDTKEYLAVMQVFAKLDNIPPKEQLFLTLQLLTMNVSSSQVLNDDKLLDLKAALLEMVNIIEKGSAIDVPNKHELIDKLYLHFKPAYYRIKYNLGLVNSMSIEFDEKLEDLHEIVKLSTRPVETILGCSIPESENTFLTMIVGGWLIQYGVQFNQKKVAAVVCPNGVSVSKLLQVNLRSIFPEFLFLEAMSHRDFSNYKGKMDILFTTHRLPTSIQQFIVPTVLNERERAELRKRVLHEKYGSVPIHVNVHELLKVVSEYAEIKNPEGLLKGLNNYLNKYNPVSEASDEVKTRLTLKDLINVKTITTCDKVNDWKEAIWLASEPLLNNQSIGVNYVEAMIEQYQNDSSYIMLAKNMAIPHSNPKNEVYKVGMSFLKLKEPVRFSGNHSVNLICVIAAVDKEQHIKPILQLRRLAESQKDINKILKAETKEEIVAIIEKFSNVSTKEW